MSDLLLIKFLGAVAFLLLGIRLSGMGFESALGEKIRVAFKKLSNRMLPAYLAGFFATVSLQSSGATVALLLSLSATNPISLPASLAIILGADLGATVIIQLISFKIASISLLIISVGAFIYLFARNLRRKAIGQGILGFGFILFAILIVTDLSASVGQIPGLPMILEGLDKAPLISFAGGLICALVFQSSTAVLALIIGFSSQNLVSIDSSIPAILGANLGATVIAFLSAFGGKERGARIAWGHLFFKFMGVIIFFPLIGYLPSFLERISFDPAHMVANMHTVFNLAISCIFLPFTGVVSKQLNIRLPDKENRDEFRLKYLDKSYSVSSSLGAAQVSREIMRMADVVRGMLADVETVIKTDNIDIIDDISNRDDIVDYLDREIKKFLSEHSQFDAGQEGGKRNVEFISVINYLEIAGDIIDKGISEQLSNKILNNFSFSVEGEREILMYHGKIVEMFDESLVSFMRVDRELANRVLNRKKVLGNLEKELKNAHIRRLNKGMKESLETSSIHLDILSSMRRIVSVCAGIAHCVVDFEE